MARFARTAAPSVPLVAAEESLSLGVLRLLPAARDAAGEAAKELVCERVHGFVAPIFQPATSLGRDVHNGIVVPDAAVSRHQALLFCQAGTWSIENVSTRNSLWVVDREVPPGARAPLWPGARIRLGHTVLQLLAPLPGRAGGSAAAAPQASAAGMQAAPRSGVISAREASSTRLLGPGVTLQFALRGRVSRGTGWTLALLVAAVFAACAVITLGSAALIGQSALVRVGAGQVLAAATIPLVPVLGVTLVVGLLDRYEREPPLMMLAAFLWGAVVAIPPALYLEGALSTLVSSAIPVTTRASSLLHAAAQAINASATEEVIKGAGLLLLLLVLRDEFDNVTDGAIYGALIGAGFAMVENFVYFANSPSGGFGFVVFGRVVLGWLSHSTFTALFGIGLGYARERPSGWRHWLAPLGGAGAAITLHALFDLVAFGADALAAWPAMAGHTAQIAALAMLGDYLPLFAVQIWLLSVVLAALAREAEVVRDHLAVEVATGVVTPDEYVLLQDARLRASAERYYGLTFGIRPYLTARALYQTATGLAFRKWHVVLGDRPKPTHQQPEDAYRQRVRRLRRSLDRQTAVAAPASASALRTGG